MAITDGLGLKMHMGGVSKGLSVMAGVRTQLHGMGRMQPEVIDRALIRMAQLMGAKITNRWQAVGKFGSQIYYIGLIPEAVSPSAAG
jgi:hypothetical protein